VGKKNPQEWNQNRKYYVHKLRERIRNLNEKSIVFSSKIENFLLLVIISFFFEYF